MIPILIFLFLLPWATLGAGGSSPQGKWTFNNSTTKIPCIILYAQIDLDLSYIVKGSDAEKDVHFTVSTASTVNQALSSCGMNVRQNGDTFMAQRLHLDLDHMPNWSIEFFFTTDPRIPTDGGKQWALYRVDINADYTTRTDLFPNATDSNHTYTNPVIFKGDNEFADYIFSPLNNSLYCPSKQKYLINSDPDVGPRASITFSLLNVQAYVVYVDSKALLPFGTRQTCPTDQHTTDKVPIIVGGCLAGLIILTMILYLVYRAFLPAEIIQLVNPHSHHENKAMSLDEEEEAGASEHS